MATTKTVTLSTAFGRFVLADVKGGKAMQAMRNELMQEAIREALKGMAR